MKNCISLPVALLEKFRSVHGDRYDYRESVYVADKQKIKIMCPEHGEFEQQPHAHKRGHKCPSCARADLGMTVDQFLVRATEVHGDRYTYGSLGGKIKTKGKVEIFCPTHGPFNQRAGAHISPKQKAGCPQCGLKTTRNKRMAGGYKTFITNSKKVFGDRYDYSRVEYKGAHVHVEIDCPKHGWFWQTPANHCTGHHCSQCAHENRPISLGEKAIAEWLDASSHGYQREKTFEDLVNPETGYQLRYDFYINAKNLLIEFDGEHHFEPIRGDVGRFEKIQALDVIKNEYAEQNGIALLRISDRSQITTILQANLG